MRSPFAPLALALLLAVVLPGAPAAAPPPERLLLFLGEPGENWMVAKVSVQPEDWLVREGSAPCVGIGLEVDGIPAEALSATDIVLVENGDLYRYEPWLGVGPAATGISHCSSRAPMAADYLVVVAAERVEPSLEVRVAIQPSTEAVGRADEATAPLAKGNGAALALHADAQRLDGTRFFVSRGAEWSYERDALGTGAVAVLGFHHPLTARSWHVGATSVTLAGGVGTHEARAVLDEAVATREGLSHFGQSADLGTRGVAQREASHRVRVQLDVATEVGGTLQAVTIPFDPLAHGFQVAPVAASTSADRLPVHVGRDCYQMVRGILTPDECVRGLRR